MSIFVGQDVSYALTCTTAAGAAANPTGVVFRVKNPAGTTTVYTYGVSAAVAETTAGMVFTLTMDTSSAGRWYVRGEILIAGLVVGVSEDVMFVQPSYIV